MTLADELKIARVSGSLDAVQKILDILFKDNKAANKQAIEIRACIADLHSVIYTQEEK